MEDVQDILDLCQLNLMEENIKDTTETCTASSSEVQSFKDAIKFGKRKVANRIINSQINPASGEKEREEQNDTCRTENEESGIEKPDGRGTKTRQPLH